MLKRALIASMTMLLLAAATKAYTSQNVYDLARQEQAAIEAAGFTFPPFALYSHRYSMTSGLTMTSEQPVRHVVLLQYSYWQGEDEARGVAAHELGHVLLNESVWRLTLDEQERFANWIGACFGTDGARQWLKANRRADPTADQCETLYRWLTTPPFSEFF